ncbi:hypothetical protein [Ekhidna sp. To15]|uniref:hypothetical protein n=1 Tax=Ekhidna sp. To15 TaxID=3395267 RepID=UPI003F51BFDA
MFLRKLFNSENKLTWVFVDLLIVIIGVYCAFLIQNYAENEKNLKERDRVVSALKYEIEAFRFQMTQISGGMVGYSKQLNNVLQQGSYGNFSDYRFIEPQYDYQTIEYALNLQNSEIIDFELYNVLQSLFVEIKKIEHVERLLTETSRRYKTIPSNISKETVEYKLTWTENYDNFDRFVTLITDRGEIASRIATASEGALPLINERLGIQKSRAVERELIIRNMGLAKNEQEAVFLVKTYFPDFTEEEIRELYRKANSSETTNPTDSIGGN